MPELFSPRDAVDSAAFRELLGLLDIDSMKDAELVAGWPLQNGLHHYSDWFFCRRDAHGGRKHFGTLRFAVLCILVYPGWSVP
jgi:hypothetical protein